jgi:transcriptional regulator of arginine metabolism
MQAQSPPQPAKLTDDRRSHLRRLIKEVPVRRQAELVSLLQQAGFTVTQSSISRDLRELGVAKRGDRYVLAERDDSAVASLTAVQSFLLDFTPAGANLIVLKTSIGSAPTVAAAIDRAQWPEVAGTLSGDDTIFLATPDVVAQRAVLQRLNQLLPR